MKVLYIERKLNSKEISIEKLFNLIRSSLQNKGVKCQVLKNPYNFGLFQIFKGIVYFARRQGPITHITGDVHWACLLMNRNRTVLTIHDVGRYYQIKGIRRLFYFLLWFYFPVKKLKHITAISHKTKDDILKLLPWAENKITVIPNCFTMEADYSKITPLNRIPIIIIVGTRSNKNIERALLALKDIDVQVNIVGELDQKQIYLIHQLGIKYHNYTFIDESTLIKLYDESDILLFPSLFEGFGLPILEAQARKCVVVTSDIEPMKNIGGLGAIFVDPLSVDSILRGVNEAINLSFTSRKQMIENGRNNLNRFDADRIADNYLSIYRKINNDIG